MDPCKYTDFLGVSTAVPPFDVTCNLAFQAIDNHANLVTHHGTPLPRFLPS